MVLLVLIHPFDAVLVLQDGWQVGGGACRAV